MNKEMSNLEQQIQRFEEQTGIKLIIKDKRPFYGGYLDLNGTGITSLPDNLHGVRMARPAWYRYHPSP